MQKGNPAQMLHYTAELNYCSTFCGEIWIFVKLPGNFAESLEKFKKSTSSRNSENVRLSLYLSSREKNCQNFPQVKNYLS